MAKKSAPAKAAARARTRMSNEHKAALAEGREQGRAVRQYLEALELHKPKRGRKRTSESVQRRLETIEERMPNADPLSRLLLIQERIDLQEELAGMGGDGVDLSQLEADFVASAAGYGGRRGITYSAWRASGVSAAVLRQAGIGRAAQ